MSERKLSLFGELGLSIGNLLDEKNEAYGDSFAKAGSILHVLYPDGVRPEQYRDLLAITRILDKLFRIATNKDAFGESPWRDVAGYAILALANDKRDKRESARRSVVEMREKYIKAILPEEVSDSAITRGACVRVQRLNGEHWEDTEFEDLRVGDRFRAFLPDESVPYGFYVVTGSPFLTPDGKGGETWGVRVGELDADACVNGQPALSKRL